MEKSKNLSSLLCLMLVGLLLISCTSGQKYQYDRIQTDYADLARSTPSADNVSTHDETYDINQPLSLRQAIEIAFPFDRRQELFNDIADMWVGRLLSHSLRPYAHLGAAIAPQYGAVLDQSNREPIAGR